MKDINSVSYIVLAFGSKNYHRFKEYLDKHSKTAEVRKIKGEWTILYPKDMLSLIYHNIYINENNGKFKFKYKGKFCMSFKDKYIHYHIDEDYVIVY